MDRGAQLFTLWSLWSLICISFNHIHSCLVHCSSETKVSCLAHCNFYRPEVSQYVYWNVCHFSHKSEARERPQALPLQSRAEMRARKQTRPRGPPHGRTNRLAGTPGWCWRPPFGWPLPWLSPKPSIPWWDPIQLFQAKTKLCHQICPAQQRIGQQIGRKWPPI